MNQMIYIQKPFSAIMEHLRLVNGTFDYLPVNFLTKTISDKKLCLVVMHFFVVINLLITNGSNDLYTEKCFQPLQNISNWSMVLLTTFKSFLDKSFSGKKLYL